MILKIWPFLRFFGPWALWMDPTVSGPRFSNSQWSNLPEVYKVNQKSLFRPLRGGFWENRTHRGGRLSNFKTFEFKIVFLIPLMVWKQMFRPFWIIFGRVMRPASEEVRFEPLRAIFFVFHSFFTKIIQHV